MQKLEVLQGGNLCRGNEEEEKIKVALEVWGRGKNKGVLQVVLCGRSGVRIGQVSSGSYVLKYWY